MNTNIKILQIKSYHKPTIHYEEALGIAIEITKDYYLKEWADNLTSEEFQARIGKEISEQILISLLQNKIKF